MMRQAGRYLPEYRELKSRYDFLTLCKTPELAVEVTLQPLRRFSPDAAILFADILLPAECLGIDVAFNPGPQVANPITSPADVAALRPKPVAPTLGYVFDAVAALRREIPKTVSADTALLGFAGAPYTMACYLLKQQPYKHFEGTQIFAAEHPKAFHQLLTLLTEITTDYLLAQAESGAQAVQLFDTWAGNLSDEQYRKLALPYAQQIFAALKQKGVPSIHYANGASHLLFAMRESGADCIGIDWRTDLAKAEEIVGPDIALQGNFDSTRLYGSTAEVAAATSQMLASLKRRTGYIANLGHGILQTTPVENAGCFIETVKRGWSGEPSA